MFDAIAGRYDLMNRLISLGVDRGWRARTVAALGLERGHRVLDVATGTGDLAIAIARGAEEVNVVGVDPSAGMLDVARRKIASEGATGSIEVVRASAEDLPFEEDAFDACSIAFGIRNVTDRPRALSEMARVTRPGGRVAVLELSEPRSGFLAPFARFHIHRVVPWLGSVLSGAREYRYLEQSIARFPSPSEFAGMMESSGLSVLRVEPLTFGVSCLYVAEPAP
jgi:demethylmenaquinone methyltransferase/2-methoxy-6-polyprenyl-1,4-benzoquinol methylase